MALGCAVLWAGNALILRDLSARVTPAAINTIRCGAAGVAFLLLLPFHEAPTALADVPWVDWALLLSSVTIGIVVGDTLYLVSLREIGVSRAMPLSGSFPVATLFFERLLLGTPLEAEVLSGSVLVAAGVVLLARGRVHDPQAPMAGSLRLGLLCALAASLLWGFAVTLLKPALEHLTQIQANAVRMPLVSLLLYVVVVRRTPQRLTALGLRTWLLVSITGLLGMGLGAYLFLTAVTAIGPARAVTLTSVSPVFGLALAALFLRERVDRTVLLGAACCVAGVWAVI